ncbi:MAG: Asp-tRNA(Asn)/Glu-tRNA(Gln) amidotransferase subunit GatC [Cytophagales bacterium]|nr:Asp-tRNA(Asn)/Glu-tRNA(Gln) amidotransferase subunit GatC [Cytophagales bacterium]
MKIDKHLLRKVAHMARLELEEKEEEAMLQDLNKIIAWVEKLDELDTKDVQPLTTISLEKNVLREDQPQVSLPKERGLKNAPRKDTDYFRVPKIKT